MRLFRCTTWIWTGNTIYCIGLRILTATNSGYRSLLHRSAIAKKSMEEDKSVFGWRETLVEVRCSKSYCRIWTSCFELSAYHILQHIMNQLPLSLEDGQKLSISTYNRYINRSYLAKSWFDKQALDIINTSLCLMIHNIRWFIIC